MAGHLINSSPRECLNTRSILKNSLIAVAFLLSGTTQDVKANQRAIVAVEPLVCDLVKAIAPPPMPIKCLIGRNVDVHDVVLTPSQAKDLDKASQVFTLGHEMTPAMKKWQKKSKTVVVGVSAIDIEEDHDNHSSARHHDHHDDHDDEPLAQITAKGHDHHNHGELDPHVWHDPLNIIKMGNVISANINKNLSSFDGETKKILRDRSKSVNVILEDLNQWTQKQVATIPSDQRTLVSKHKSMEYFGKAFGLNTISLLDVLGSSASLRPQAMTTVLRELREGNVKVLFPEQKPSSKLLKNLSRQTSIPIAPNQIYVDGLMTTGNTISVAVHNTCSIVNSLGGSCNKTSGSQIGNRWDSLTNR